MAVKHRALREIRNKIVFVCYRGTRGVDTILHVTRSISKKNKKKKIVYYITAFTNFAANTVYNILYYNNNGHSTIVG